MNIVIRVLTFLRLVDPFDGNLSLTNIALIAVLGKLLFTPTASITDVVPMFISMAAYTAKKVINANAA